MVVVKFSRFDLRSIILASNIWLVMRFKNIDLLINSIDLEIHFDILDLFHLQVAQLHGVSRSNYVFETFQLD